MFPLQEFHVLTKLNFSLWMWAVTKPPKVKCLLEQLILFPGTNLCKEHAADL